MPGSDKESVVQEIRTAYGEFKDSVKGLSEEALNKPFLGTWSCREVTGHIIGWLEQMTTGFERMARGERPSPDGADWGNVQSWNDRFAERVKNSKAGDLLKDLDGHVEKMIAAIKALPEDRFGEGKTANRMAQASGFGHFREHAPEIRQARESGEL